MVLSLEYYAASVIIPVTVISMYANAKITYNHVNELHPIVGTDCTGFDSIGPIAGYGPYCYSTTFLYFEGAYLMQLNLQASHSAIAESAQRK